MKLYREGISNEINQALESDSLAQSLLFSGPKYSGRLSLALDLAKKMGIRDIMFFPSRDLSIELDASYNLLKEKYSKRFIDYFISSVSRITMQYHPALQTEGAKEKLFSQAADIADLVGELKDLDIEERTKVIKCADKIFSLANKSDLLFRGRKKGSIAVDEVRAIQNYLIRNAQKSMVIIENIEDSPEASRNALLKILEEPYSGLYFVLISSQSQRILTTILSRLRKYNFSPLNKNDLDYYLKSEFLADKTYDSYEDFLFEMSASEEDRKLLRDNAEALAFAFIERKLPSVDELDELYKALEKYPQYFLSLLIKRISSSSIDARRSYSILKRLSDSMLSYSVYNQNIKSAIDLALREECFVC